MRILLIGGTGTISMAITKKLFQEKKHEIYLLNRGNRIKELPEGIISIICDIEREEAVKQALFGIHFDVVVDFIAFTPNHRVRISESNSCISIIIKRMKCHLISYTKSF